eukprot:5546480-Amphidinium_carterae.1
MLLATCLAEIKLPKVKALKKEASILCHSRILTKNNKVLQLQKVKNTAIRRRQKMLLTGRARTDEMEDEFYSLKKTSDGSIRL